ncbi:MAG TPA: SDR family NAD(P)-dependent oxidoreductase [Kofleriaceae bacterium]|nr:SDR family NAD(P)-dependent oxidoreductase [Kofleriaceae bacterium]
MKLWDQPRTALVTGASRGIGRAIALGLAREGASVAIVGRTRETLDQTVEQLTSHGVKAAGIRADLANMEEVPRAIEAAARELGSIDILVNNAGENQLGRFEEMPHDEWWHQVELNLRSPTLASRAVIPGMLARRWGRIINIASVNAKRGVNFSSAYCAAKAGLLGLTRALAMEYAQRGITVNAVCPGFVQTQLTERLTQQRTKLFNVSAETVLQATLRNIPQNVVMTPEDIVTAVLFLASDGAIRTTGEALNVSAGMVMD